MKKISSTLALAALIGAASLTSPAHASFFSNLYGKAKDKATEVVKSDEFRQGAKDLAEKGARKAKDFVTSDKFKQGAKDVAQKGYDMAKDYVDSKMYR